MTKEISIKYFKCITNKYGNFKVNKIYKSHARFEHIDGTPCDFRVTDEDGDYYTIDFKRYPRQRRMFTEVRRCKK